VEVTPRQPPAPPPGQPAAPVDSLAETAQKLDAKQVRAELVRSEPAGSKNEAAEY
jgi:hypothetical protein